jgi:hypothetical protein
VHYDRTRPYIHRLRVCVVAQDLRGHVQHRPTFTSRRFGVVEVQLSTEAEVSDLEPGEFILVGEEDVVWVSRELPGLMSLWMILTE